MKTCYIVGAGDFFGDFTPLPDDLVIAADGGYDTLCRVGIGCNLLVGDMDSINSSGAPVEKLVFPVEKDETDMHLAYRIGVERGYTNFRIYGGVGGRIDHTFANFSLLSFAKNEGNTVVLVADKYEIFAMKNEKISLGAEKDKTFSVFAFGAEAKGVRIKGAKYDIESATLTPHFPLGVSNSFTDSECEIEVEDGILLVMREI